MRKGEEEIDSINSVEDTKGNNGERGSLIISNLRIIWVSHRNTRTNLSKQTDITRFRSVFLTIPYFLLAECALSYAHNLLLSAGIGYNCILNVSFTFVLLSDVLLVLRLNEHK